MGKLTPAEKQAVRKSAWQKKRAELNGLEAVGQRDDSYVFPYQRPGRIIWSGAQFRSCLTHDLVSLRAPEHEHLPFKVSR